MTDLTMYSMILKDIRKLQALVDKLKAELEYDASKEVKKAA